MPETEAIQVKVDLVDEINRQSIEDLADAVAKRKADKVLVKTQLAPIPQSRVDHLLKNIDSYRGVVLHNLKVISQIPMPTFELEERVDMALRLQEDMSRIGGVEEILHGPQSEFSEVASELGFHMKEFVKHGHLDTVGTRDFLKKALRIYDLSVASRLG